MSRIGACASVAVCIALILGSSCLPVHAEDGDDVPPPPPRGRSKLRLAAPIRRAAAEQPDGEAAAQPADGEPEAAPRKTPGKRLRPARPIQPVAGEEPEGEPAAEPAEGEPEGAPRAAAPKRLPRGQMQPLRMSSVTQEMLDVLLEWEKSSSQITSLRGPVNRITYDKVFMIEKQGAGEFYFRAPDTGSFKLDPIEVKAGLGRKGFQQKPETAEHWVCTGAELIKINHEQKTYESIVIPPESRGKAIMDTPLPFLLGMKANQARQRYTLELKENPRNTGYLIKVLPRLQKDAANYCEAEVLLDYKTYLPVAVRMLDPAKTRETVLIFGRKLEVNKGLGIVERDPTKPNLARYKRVQANDRANQARGNSDALPDGLDAGARR